MGQNANYDPIKLIVSASLNERLNMPIVEDAISVLSKHFDEDKFLPIISSLRPEISEIGLQILSEIGVRGKAAIPLALIHVKHKSWQARFYLVDFLISCVKEVDAQEISNFLFLVNDINENVRCKMIDFLYLVQLNLLENSIKNKNIKYRKEHLIGFDILQNVNATDDLLSLTESNLKSTVCYACAKILRIFQEKKSFPTSTLAANSPELDHLIWKLNMMVKYSNKK